MKKDKSCLINFIKNTNGISEEKAIEISNYFNEIIIQKNNLFLEEGKICHQYLFLETGFMRAFTMDIEGNDVTTNFYSNQQIVFEVASYFQQKPSNENIQALTDCKGWVGNHELFMKLFHTIPEFREFGRTILVKEFIALKERNLSMINQKAELRYERLINSNTELFQYAPLKFIASYLGITDTSLSRIRKELFQK
jgi:CRP-like cAMP-binding protein